MKIERLRRHGGVHVLLAAMLAGCGPSEPQSAPPAAKVATTTVVPAHLELTEDLPGRVAAVRVAEIRPQVSGIVQRRLFEQGTEVRAGQPLFQINPAPSGPMQTRPPPPCGGPRLRWRAHGCKRHGSSPWSRPMRSAGRPTTTRCRSATRPPPMWSRPAPR